MHIKETKHTSRVIFKILPMDSCSQAARSSFVTVVFFFVRPRAGRGDGTVGVCGVTATEGRGIGLGGGFGEDGEDGEVEEDDALAICCSFASLFKRIYGDSKSSVSVTYPDLGGTYAIGIILGCRSIVAHDRSENEVVSRGRPCSLHNHYGRRFGKATQVSVSSRPPQSMKLATK